MRFNLKSLITVLIATALVLAFLVNWILPRLPNIGAPVPAWATPSGNQMVVASGESLDSHSFQYKDAEFWIGSSEGIIKCVSTCDPTFTTTDGITVDSTLNEVMKIATQKPKVIRGGIAIVFELPSGWKVAFGPTRDGTGPSGGDSAQYLYLD